jgi:hypothetical protein
MGSHSILDTKQELDQNTGGVRINCHGDEKVDGRPKFEPVEIPAYNWIFEEEAMPISARLDCSMVAQRIPGSFAYWEERPNATGESVWTNEAATFLHLGCDPEAKQGMLENKYSFGGAPMEWQNKVGSVVIMRKDKKLLLPEDVAALAEYYQFHLNDLFQEQGKDNISEDDELEEISKDKFVEYFEAWKIRQSEKKKQDYVSPYDV